ncbi:ferritin heavy chain B-like [Styela clava]|uniref:ferritin heavy chain B-like n=1 Tax=Styela clava TaxID=7725 RepID=UPI001939E41C|nr:ferritin heavy chain B-like [Styela clava]
MSQQTKATSEWAKECETGLNGQIRLELYASYTYLSLSHFFDRNDVALHKISEYFKEQSHEEREHAEKMMKYHNKRGGNTVFSDITAPQPLNLTNCSIIKAMQAALELEETVYRNLLKLHDTAENDPEFQDFIEANFLHEQVDAIHKLKGYITNLKRVGEGLGEFLFNKHFEE